ncbi:hypothetical protein [Apilactobacillus xinyiensis]|uniref:Uncharacterized protein n=1 Tax=Apilactobacillus xinyiensis TaxID=2841032 RepID=A0ABT0I1X9_9LACO|nr:hypothetical protein [Apilactobacillus xinyiensis]MCK8624711.1 hypothetical protein [Apilactobacillus xinyiensis]MCL0318826.1 hypothetical protein [Apilactobacillus xinyiensis]MCL0329932.1 hypothetical protein [Apilactobacillus xinyiensis]
MRKNSIDYLSASQLNLYESAQISKSKDDFTTAIDKLIEIYDEVQLNFINCEIVNLLFKEKRYREAKKYILLNPDVYLLNVDNIKLFVKVFLENADFILLRKTVTSFNDEKLKHEIFNEINVYELNYEKQFHDSLQSKVREFAHLGNYEFFKQKEILEASMKLPLDYFVKYGKYLLIDPFVHPLIKSSIVDTFREVNFKEIVSEYFIDGNVKKIKIANLKKLEETKSFKMIISKIDNSKLSKDPINKTMFLQYIKLNFMIIYPFNDILIKNINLWFEYFYNNFIGETFSADNDERNKINAMGTLILSIYSKILNV